MRTGDEVIIKPFDETPNRMQIPRVIWERMVVNNPHKVTFVKETSTGLSMVKLETDSLGLYWPSECLERTSRFHLEKELFDI